MGTTPFLLPDLYEVAGTRSVLTGIGFLESGRDDRAAAVLPIRIAIEAPRDKINHGADSQIVRETDLYLSSSPITSIAPTT